ncbi:nitroreductase/quinone reductase family protein [Smaragdicoccus niigatensis]
MNPMAYVKPPFLVRNVLNKVAMATGIGGTETLVVKGRTSGEPRKVPVTPIRFDGVQYLVSVRGEAEWVRNVRAAGQIELVKKGSSRTVSATEVPVSEAGPVIAHYREKLGSVVKGYWEQLPDDADHPVFALGGA